MKTRLSRRRGSSDSSRFGRFDCFAPVNPELSTNAPPGWLFGWRLRTIQGGFGSRDSNLTSGAHEIFRSNEKLSFPPPTHRKFPIASLVGHCILDAFANGIVAGILRYF
jgi:hypothetical protein